LLVLLHGWRARGDDLVSLARALATPGARFLIPAAPVPEPNGGRAWWSVDTPGRPAPVSSDTLPPHYPRHPQLEAARHAVQALVREAKRSHAPDSIAIAGFSQGAMLALDVALAADPPIDRVAVLSGALLADSLPAVHVERRQRPAVFVSHGRADPRIPFATGASIERILAPRGYNVTFFPFGGGHEITAEVVAQLRRFLFDASG
jgi:phospholipase/carboxylesterase